MKFIYCAILAGFLAGCAHVSEYNQGCRDGVTRSTTMRDDNGKRGGVNNVGYNQDVTNYFCDMLDAQHKNAQKDGHK